MDRKETNVRVSSKTSLPDRSVILKLLDFLGQWPNPKPSQDENVEQTSPLPTSHPK